MIDLSRCVRIPFSIDKTYVVRAGNSWFIKRPAEGEGGCRKRKTSGCLRITPVCVCSPRGAVAIIAIGFA